MMQAIRQAKFGVDMMLDMGDFESEVNERKQLALKLHAEGCNCAQSVACALCDTVQADRDYLFRSLEGFGAGMGIFSETCGAISGGVALIGCRNSAGYEIKKSKGATYKIVRRFVEEFRSMNGSTLCSELKGIQTKKPLRSCDGCIEDACEIAYRLLKEMDESSLGKQD